MSCQGFLDSWDQFRDVTKMVSHREPFANRTTEDYSVVYFRLGA